MKQIKILVKLNLNYLKRNKKSFLSLSVGVFLSVFLITSIFIAKDSYNHNLLESSLNQFGSWDISYLLSNQMDEREKAIIENTLTDKMLVKHLDYQLPSKTTNFFAVPKFEDGLFSFSLESGTYPKNDKEIFIDDIYASSKKLSVGDKLFFDNSNGLNKNFTISGIFQKKTVDLNTTFYTLSNQQPSVFTEVFAVLKDKSKISFFEGDYSIFQINKPVVEAKYSEHQTLKQFSYFALAFFFLCSLLFVFSTNKIHLRKKSDYFKKLSYIGATKKQLLSLIFLESFFISGAFFIISFLLSCFIWWLFINCSSQLLMNSLNASMPLEFVLHPSSFFIIIFLITCIFLISLIIALFANRNKTENNLHFRKLRLKYLPISLRLGLIDIVRKRYGFLICLSIIVSSTLFACTQFMMNTLVDTTSPEYATYANNIEANFSIYDVTSIKLDKFFKEYETVCKQNATIDCQIEYELVSLSTLENKNLSVTLIGIDEQTLKSFITKQNLNDKTSPIIINQNKVLSQNENITVKLLSQFQEELSTFNISVQTVENSPVFINSKDDFIALFSQEQISNLVDTHTGAHINGTISIKTENSAQAETLLNNSVTFDGDDYIYTQNLDERKDEYERNIFAIQTILYFLNSIVILVCVFNIINLQYQYFYNRKEDIKLINAIGMTHKQIQIQFATQVLLYLILSLVISGILSLSIITLISNYYKEFIINYKMIYSDLGLFSVVLIPVMLMITIYNSSKALKNEI